MIWLLVTTLCFSLAANLLGFYGFKKLYRKTKLQAVFPATSSSYPLNNTTSLSRADNRVVLFGDSRISDWTLLPNVTGLEFINKGVAGETSAQSKLRLERDVLDLAPDLVILQIGVNDLVTIGVAPELEERIVAQLIRNLEYLVESIREQDIPVLILTIIQPSTPPFYRLPVWSSRIPLLVEKTNEWLEKLASSEDVTVLNSAEVLDKGGGNIYRDTLHLNNRGYSLLNKTVEDYLHTRH